jgi:NAD(P)-dependent dehydrogenase (short-subunit alcohol dehydrogenase family)
MGYLEERANLNGKVAAVIGGGSGVGAATTLSLAKAGVDIAFCDINGQSIEPTVSDVNQLGRHVTGRTTDATDPDQLSDFYDALDEDFDRLDIVVNVAGYASMRPFSETTSEHWEAAIHRNLGWVMRSISLALPRIRRGGQGGSIINFTTIEAHRGAATLAAYAGAKAGLTNFSRALAVELAPERIRVNCVAPDTTPSETSSASPPENVKREIAATPPELLVKMMEMYIPMGVPPTAEDIGDAVLILASDLSSTVTGTTLHVDGGTWASSGFLHWPGTIEWSCAPPPSVIRGDASPLKG